MNLKKILSNRFIEKYAYMEIVHEWEDDFSEQLNIPIVSSGFVRPNYEKLIYNRVSSQLLNNFFLVGLLQKINQLFNSKNKSLYFDLYPVSTFLNSNSVRVNNIPIIIDFWKYENTDNFYNAYKNCKIVFITSLEVLNYLKRIGIKLDMYHLPVSLSDRYRSIPQFKRKKSIDIVLAGRRDKKLTAYLTLFCEKYKDVEYVFQVQRDGNIYYESNKRGIIGVVNSREEYLNLIGSGLISFYSTPGIDDGAIRTGGFNPVTPRYLELLAAKCFLLGRYPENEETDFFELQKVCPNIDNYEQFESILLSYLNKKNSIHDFDIYDSILNKHYTSNRITELLRVVN